ncbi:MAG TPA: mannose-6-phosphate isomerase, class I [Microlunatus sp.]|nr:mannose-6-phosphate isomerase, class I [Microlunatus sp.]
MRRLTGTIQPYAWGSSSVIAELLGVEPTGEPQAELWLGAHTLHPSTIDGTPLTEIIAADPNRVIGPASVAAWGPRLPYLMKVLAAAQPLSLQAHPSRAQAQAGYDREQASGVPRDAAERNYRDGWPKPEALCALEPTEALCGFREPQQTYDLFVRLGVESAVALVEPLRDGSSAHLAQVFSRLLHMSRTDEARRVVDEVVEAARHTHHDPALADFALIAVELARFYPGDPGVLAALMMNRIEFGPYDAIYLPPGDLHAYLRGGGIEIMANSDNVLRGGLTPKHIDVDELLAVLDFTPSCPTPVPCVEEPPGVFSYKVPAREFALWRIEQRPGSGALPGGRTGRVVLVIEGHTTLTSAQGTLELHRGQSAFVYADETVSYAGEGMMFVGGPGLR